MVLKNMLDLALFDNEDSSIKNNLKKTKFNSIKTKLYDDQLKLHLICNLLCLLFQGKKQGVVKPPELNFK